MHMADVNTLSRRLRDAATRMRATELSVTPHLAVPVLASELFTASRDAEALEKQIAIFRQLNGCPCAADRVEEM